MNLKIRMFQGEKAADFSIRVKDPFNFYLTLKKPAGWDWSTPYEAAQERRAWCTLRLESERFVGVKLECGGKEVMCALYSVNGIGEAEVEEAKDLISFGLGAEVDLSGFYEFAKNDRVLWEAVKHLYGMKPYFATSVFERALLAICLQMAPVNRSMRMLRCLIDNYGETMSFDGKTVRHWPSRSFISHVGRDELARRCGLGYRADFISRLSSLRVIPSLRGLVGKPTEVAVKKLTELPGIGRHSAGVILARNTFPVDVWSSRIFYRLFFNKTPENPREVIREVEEEAERRYGEWKWEAFAYVLNALPKVKSLL